MRWFNSLIVLAWVCSVEAAYVVTQSGRQINGAKISASSDGSITLTTATGQQMTFRTGQYRQAVADQPPELAQAEQLLKDGQAEQAVVLLKKVKAGYRFLAWDQKATYLLGNHFYDSGQFAEAAAEFQSLENLDDETVQAQYRDALLKSGKADAVLPVLEKDIASGSREAAARAYLMRGDLKTAAGDTEGARRDYLKVATFFKAQKEAAQEAEARMSNNELGISKVEGAGK
jgi:predicted negative regulator of RcsB-dependent stress response